VVKLYSYVVEHDNGYAPNPYFGLCTLCRCKFRERPEVKRRNIVELAEEGDWVIGTGGASKKSAGHGKLVYAMRVDEKPTRWKYFTDSRFEQKKPVKTGTYEQTRGDNEEPSNCFEKHKQFALVSWQFYYFGANAIDIREFKLEKKGPWFRRHFDPADIDRFIKWLKKQNPGKHGEPCYREPADEPKGSMGCESSC
jgi:Nucleotide modification associated domain 2